MPLEEGLEPDNNISGQVESLDVLFPLSNTPRTFDNNVQTALYDPAEQEEVERTLKNPHDVTTHKDTTKKRVKP